MTTMTAPSMRLARLGGLLIGLALCATVVLHGRMPEQGGALPARLTVRPAPATPVLGVSPSRRFLSTSDLTPGPPEAGASGTVTVRNQSARPLEVRLRVARSNRDLDDVLRLELAAGGERVFRGRLRALRRWTERSFELRSLERMRVRVRAWLPASLRGGYEARGADLTLEWKTRRLGA
jgi:hypothetical protein